MILASRALPPVSGQVLGQDFDQWCNVTHQLIDVSTAIHIVILIIVAENVSPMFSPRIWDQNLLICRNEVRN